VARSYRELERDAVIETRGRAGTFIAASGDATQRQVQDAAAALAAYIRQLRPRSPPTRSIARRASLRLPGGRAGCPRPYRDPVTQIDATARESTRSWPRSRNSPARKHRNATTAARTLRFAATPERHVRALLGEHPACAEQHGIAIGGLHEDVDVPNRLDDPAAHLRDRLHPGDAGGDGEQPTLGGS
jgi:hypothetical protein